MDIGMMVFTNSQKVGPHFIRLKNLVGPSKSSMFLQNDATNAYRQNGALGKSKILS